jgi:hypothetical protein
MSQQDFQRAGFLSATLAGPVTIAGTEPVSVEGIGNQAFSLNLPAAGGAAIAFRKGSTVVVIDIEAI